MSLCGFVIFEIMRFFFFFLYIQFLGRDKEEGVRRSAISGKKVGHFIVLLEMFICPHCLTVFFNFLWDGGFI